MEEYGGRLDENGDPTGPVVPVDPDAPDLVVDFTEDDDTDGDDDSTGGTDDVDDPDDGADEPDTDDGDEPDTVDQCDVGATRTGTLSVVTKWGSKVRLYFEADPQPDNDLCCTAARTRNGAQTERLHYLLDRHPRYYADWTPYIGDEFTWKLNSVDADDRYDCDDFTVLTHD